MKYIFGIIFILMMGTVSGQLFSFDFSNFDNIREYATINGTATTQFHDLINNVSTMGKEYLCKYQDEATLPSCWTEPSGSVVLESTNLFLGNATMRLPGGAGASSIRFQAPTDVNLTYYFWILGQDGGTGQGDFANNNGAGNSLVSNSDSSFLQFRDGSLVRFDSNIARNSNSEWYFGGIIGHINSGLPFWGNGTFTDHNFDDHPIGSSSSFILFESVNYDGPPHSTIDEVYILNATPAYNTSAVRREWNITTITSTTDFIMTYIGSDPAVSDIVLGIGCVESGGINFINTTTNGSQISCAEAVTQIIPFTEIYNTSTNYTVFTIDAGVSVDTTPPTIIVVSPANDTTTNQNPFNITLNVTDDSSFNITCSIRNSSDIFILEQIFEQSTLEIFNIVNATEGINDLEIICLEENAVNNTASETLRINIDTINPLITITSPINNTITTTDITVDLNCNDPGLTLFNYSFFNSSTEVQTFENTSVDGNNLDIDDTIVVAGLGSGTYNMEIFCVNGVNTAFQLLELVIDNEPAFTLLQISNTTPIANDIININVTCIDTIGLSSIEGSDNKTGVQVNETLGVITGLEGIFFDNHTTSLGTIELQYTCTDTSGLSDQTSVIYTASTAPEVIITLGIETYPYDELLNFVIITLIVIFIVSSIIVRGKSIIGGAK